MNDNANNTHPSGSAAPQRHAIRFLVDDPVLGWKIFPLTRALAANRGDLRLPEYAGCSLRIAFAHVEIVGGHLAKLTRLDCSGWLLDAEGRINQDKLMRDNVESIDPVEGAIDFRLLASVPVTSEDIMSIRRCLGVEVCPKHSKSL